MDESNKIQINHLGNILFTIGEVELSVSGHLNVKHSYIMWNDTRDLRYVGKKTKLNRG